MNRFEILNEIDEGAFGIVQMARNKETGEIVAIKKIKRKYNSWEECMALREIKSLKKLKHPNIIKLKEVFKLEQELFLVFEYCRTNLFKLYNDEYKAKGNQMPESLIKSLVYQIASSLAYMHKLGFFHRDLKPENLLITERNVLKMADFGLAREIRSSPPYTDYVSTRWYRAPEILLKSTNYNSPVDIFALGCIMAELYLQAPLFNGASEIDQLSKIFAVLGSPGKNWPEGVKLASQIGFNFPTTPALNLADLIKNASPDAIDLMKAMLNFDSSRRPTAARLLQHPYFTGSGGSHGGPEPRTSAFRPILGHPQQCQPRNDDQNENQDHLSAKFGSGKQNKAPGNQFLNFPLSKENLIAPFQLEQKIHNLDPVKKLDHFYSRLPEPVRVESNFRGTPIALSKGQGFGLEHIYKSDLTGKKNALDLDIEELENEMCSHRKKAESRNSSSKKAQKENNYDQTVFVTKKPIPNMPNIANNSNSHRLGSFLNQNLLDDPLEVLLNKEQMLIERKEEKGQLEVSGRNRIIEVSGIANGRVGEFGFAKGDEVSNYKPLEMGKGHKYTFSSSTQPGFGFHNLMGGISHSHTPSYLNGINVLNKNPKVAYHALN